ncbi:MAG: hypothetical protein ACT4P6_19425 [Gemmatimonadaceae bacterium]
MTSTGYDIYASDQTRRALGYRWENDAYMREPDMAHGTFGAMGGVQISANDYARWIAFLLSAWPPRDGAEDGPVRRATVREMSQGRNFPQLVRRPGSSATPCTAPLTYGMGLGVAIDCDAGRSLGVSAALAQAYRATAAMYEAGAIDPGRSALAMNFLMDRSEENWKREFTRLKGETGACRTDAPITATGALAGAFMWSCERANLTGSLLLAPTNPPTIQALRLNAARRSLGF